jgi:hypothetical protein
MPHHTALRFTDTARDHTVCVSSIATTPVYNQLSLETSLYGAAFPSFPLGSRQAAKLSSLIIPVSTTAQDNRLKQLVSFIKMVRSYSVADYVTRILVSKPSVSGPIVIQPPKRRVLASMEVRLPSKDFKRRTPRPVILLETEAGT